MTESDRHRLEADMEQQIPKVHPGADLLSRRFLLDKSVLHALDAVSENHMIFNRVEPRAASSLRR